VVSDEVNDMTRESIGRPPNGTAAMAALLRAARAADSGPNDNFR